MGRSATLRPMSTQAPPSISERLANLRDLINNQNVDGLNAGQATAVARALDGIIADNEPKQDAAPSVLAGKPASDPPRSKAR